MVLIVLSVLTALKLLIVLLILLLLVRTDVRAKRGDLWQVIDIMDASDTVPLA